MGFGLCWAISYTVVLYCHPDILWQFLPVIFVLSKSWLYTIVAWWHAQIYAMMWESHLLFESWANNSWKQIEFVLPPDRGSGSKDMMPVYHRMTRSGLSKWLYNWPRSWWEGSASFIHIHFSCLLNWFNYVFDDGHCLCTTLKTMLLWLVTKKVQLSSTIFILTHVHTCSIFCWLRSIFVQSLE